LKFYFRKVYHVRAVTQTDVVRAGTRDVAKIFQLLYDVEAVSGFGSAPNLSMAAGQNDTLPRRNPYMSENTSNMSPMLSSTLSNVNNLSSNLNETNATHMADHTIIATNSNTLRSVASIEDYPDAISVGSNESGEVSGDDQ
jgi:hypothetical protein